MNFSAVPVIMYHSVKYKRRQNWVHPHITLELNNFLKQLHLFNLLRVKTFFFDELYEHMKGLIKLPFNSILLTFDDGYLDNFVFVFPLLKRYKLKATIWVNPDFVDNTNSQIRPNLEDYWKDKITLEELNRIDGYLNWEEMRLMEKSGFVDIQSHTMSHAKYTISDKIIDFVHPETKIDWLYWNLFPEDRINFLTNPRNKIPFGYPIYESDKGNIALKCEEDGSLTQALINFVNENGKVEFFNNKDWKTQLFLMSESLKKNKGVFYRKETEEEYLARISFELRESKRVIEKNLDKKINHVCWPYGGKNETLIKLAKEIGYLTSTGSSEKNIFGKKNYQQVNRISLDNTKYNNVLFYPYAMFKILSYKL